MKIQSSNSSASEVSRYAQVSASLEPVNPDALFEEFSKTLDKVVTKLGEPMYATEIPQDSSLVSRQIEKKETKKILDPKREASEEPIELKNEDKPSVTQRDLDNEPKGAKNENSSAKVKGEPKPQQEPKLSVEQKDEAKDAVVIDKPTEEEVVVVVVVSTGPVEQVTVEQSGENVQMKDPSVLETSEDAAKIAAMLLQQKVEGKDVEGPTESVQHKASDDSTSEEEQAPLLLGEQSAQAPLEQPSGTGVELEAALKKPVEVSGKNPDLVVAKPLEAKEPQATGEMPVADSLSLEAEIAPATPTAEPDNVASTPVATRLPQAEANQSYEAKMFEVAMRAMLSTQEALELAQSSENLRQRSEISQLIQALPKGLTGLDRAAKVPQITPAQPLQFSDLGTPKQAQNSQGGESGRTRSLPKPAEARTLEKVEGALKEVAKSKDGRTISVRLDPPDLGTVKVDVTLKNDTLHARIVAEAPQVGQFLRERAHELVGMLRKLGIEAEKVSVSVGNNGQENGAVPFEQFAEHRSQSGEQQRGHKRFAPSTGEVVAAEQRVKLADDHWVA